MNIMKYRKWFYFASLVLIIPGIISLTIWRLKPSIDFTGGTKIEIVGTGNKDQIIEIARNNKFENIVINSTSKGLSLRAKEVNTENHNKFKEEIEKIDGVKEDSIETVGPTVSKEITTRAFTSVALASLLIIIYIGYSFRKVPKPVNSWEFGITAVLALLHDVLLVTGIFSLLGHFFGVEIDPLFITALLTVIGFSVHDTIVIFDRIRENLIKSSGTDFEEVVNRSVIEMLPRTLNTSFLVWSILLILFVFGGTTIRYFILALLVGILSGTYSSILNASPLLIDWQNYKLKQKRKS